MLESEKQQLSARASAPAQGAASDSDFRIQDLQQQVLLRAAVRRGRHRLVAQAERAHPRHIGTGTGLTPATSAPGLGSPPANSAPTLGSPVPYLHGTGPAIPWQVKSLQLALEANSKRFQRVARVDVHCHFIR